MNSTGFDEIFPGGERATPVRSSTVPTMDSPRFMRPTASSKRQSAAKNPKSAKENKGTPFVNSGRRTGSWIATAAKRVGIGHGKGRSSKESDESKAVKGDSQPKTVSLLPPFGNVSDSVKRTSTHPSHQSLTIVVVCRDPSQDHWL